MEVLHRIVVLVIILAFLAVNELHSAEDLRLTASQKKSLDKLRDIVKGTMPQKWMEEDINLTRCLKTRVWDVKRAAEMLKETAKWWKEYKMDNIHTEDWSEYEKEYPMYTDGVDNVGQPIMAFSFGEWDIREATLQGRLPKVIRWLLKNRDSAFQKSVENWNAGKVNATQYHFMMSLDKFNQRQHLCAQCLQLYTEYTATYENHYPVSADKIIIVNSPSAFEVVLSLVRPLFSPYTAKALQVFGSNKGQWEPIVYKSISKDQMPYQFGGTRKYN